MAFLLIMIIPLMPGYESLAFKGVATFLAALITIGGSSVIANFMAGIVTSYMNPCKVGDVLNAQLQW
ncbi:mechanosensitive ion channel [Ancylomarina longa]